MKHLHYFIALAMGATMLGSCSNDNIVDAPAEPNVIGFKAMANKTSRAEVTTANIDRFRVFGCVSDAATGANHTTIFENTTVELKDGKWSYQPTQYWAPDKDYFFVALSSNVKNPAWTFKAPDTHDNALDVNAFKGYGTVTMDILDQQGNGDRDLVYATATRRTDETISDATVVSLTFKHLLSRVAVQFTNGITSSAYSLVISNVSINGLYLKGSLELGVENMVWTTEGEAETEITTVVPDNNKLTAELPSTKSDPSFIIPAIQQLSITFDVQVKLNGVNYSKRTLTGTVPSQAFEIGHSYLFTATITTDNISDEGAKPIEFDVTKVEGWGTDTPGSVEF
ncbi:MAG: fimbrillin family protein [Muribaculaceae bacterium]|nr:fimbrillin family protein [Muribaculaceae bacterium]